MLLCVCARRRVLSASQTSMSEKHDNLRAVIMAMNRGKATGRRARVMHYHTESVRLLLLLISHSSNGLFFLSVAQQPNLHLGHLIVEVSRSPTERNIHRVGILWTSDQVVADATTTQHTTNTKDEHSCPQRYSNPRSQQSSGLSPTP